MFVSMVPNYGEDIGWIYDVIQVATGKFMKADGTPWVIDSNSSDVGE